MLQTDLSATPKEVALRYKDLWMVEVNHRNEKQLIGVGQARVWRVSPWTVSQPWP